MKRNLWTKDELILALNLYFKLPYGKLHSSTDEIIELATLLNRTPNSIAMRLSNYAACDPYHKNRGVIGLVGGLSICQPIWDECMKDKEKFIFQSELLLAQRQNVDICSKYKSVLYGIEKFSGDERLTEIKSRVNQNVFRKIVLSNYEGKCAITGIDIPELLVASHIIPWSESISERLNPENGICLSVLYDKAFDRGLIGFDSNYRVVISSSLKAYQLKMYYKYYFAQIEKTKLNLPQEFLPRKEFLEWHLDEVLLK